MTFMVIGVVAVAIGLAVFWFYCSTLEDIYAEKVDTDEAYRNDPLHLEKFGVCRFRKGRTNGQPVLLVHGANVNQHTFTSPRGNSLVDILVDRGFDCWTGPWTCADAGRPWRLERHRNQITIDDYLNDDLPTIIQFIKQETGYAKVHYCGQSLGGMLLYGYVLKYGAGDIASGVTLGAPLGFEGVKIRRSRFLIALLALYPPLVGGFARAMIPIIRALHLPFGLFPMNRHNLAKGLDSSYFYNMLEDPLPGVLKQLGQWVNKPGWKMDGGALDMEEGLKKLDFPLFALFAPQDPFVPVEKAKEFFDALPSADKRMLVCSKEQGCKHDYNHCDLAFGQDGAREVFGPIARWYETHSVNERLPLETAKIASDYQTPLDAEQRAGILSGDSFAHLSDSDLDGAPEAASASAAAAGESRIQATARETLSRRSQLKEARARAASAEPKSLDLESVSAAITALRPSLAPAPRRNVESITVKPQSGGKAASKANEPVETPASVLKALSNASGALEAFKETKKDADK